MAPNKNIKSFLESISPKQLIRFTRRFDNDASTMGYVSACGPEFFLLAYVDENIRFNRFNCIRYEDVRRLRVPSEDPSFVEKALRLRKERRPKASRISLASIEDLLNSANRLFPIVTIHRENIDPDVCHIGGVIDANAQHVTLLEIDPDASWETETTIYNTREITRIDFGGAYEDALLLVGGPAARIQRP